MSATPTEEGALDAWSDRPHQDEPAPTRPVRPASSAAPTRRHRPAAAFLAPVLLFVVTVGVWEWLSQTERLSRFVIPAPSGIADALLTLVQEAFFWEALRLTLVETLLGFVVGAGAGLLLGVLIGEVKLFRQTIYPYVVLFQSLPKVALAPLFVVWFGFGISSKVVMAATIAFFPLLVNTLTGLDSVNKNAKLLFQGYGASRALMFWKLSMPEILAAVMAGMKTAMTLALIGAIVAEFVGAQKGLGILLERFNFQLQMEMAFAVLLVLALVGLLLYLLLDVIERKVIYWRGHPVE